MLRIHPRNKGHKPVLGYHTTGYFRFLSLASLLHRISSPCYPCQLTATPHAHASSATGQMGNWKLSDWETGNRKVTPHRSDSRDTIDSDFLLFEIPPILLVDEYQVEVIPRAE